MPLPPANHRCAPRPRRYKGIIRQLKGKVRVLEREAAVAAEKVEAGPSGTEINAMLKDASDLKAQVAALRKDNTTLEAAAASLKASPPTSALLPFVAEAARVPHSWRV